MTPLMFYYYSLAACALLISSALGQDRLQGKMFNMYLSGSHPTMPDTNMTGNITHLNLAFISAKAFNAEPQSLNRSWDDILFASVASTRTRLRPDAKVLVSIGGWGDTGWEEAVRTEEGRTRWAANVATMVNDTGADGVDVDWEFPGSYTNASRFWETDAYPRLLASVRAAIGPDKLMSAAVPARNRSLSYMTNATVPRIFASLDFINVMAYDLTENYTAHASGIQTSLRGIHALLAAGVKPEAMTFGYPFYWRWSKVDARNMTACMESRPAQHPETGTFPPGVGCLVARETDPATNTTTQLVGQFAWNDGIPRNDPPGLRPAFLRAMLDGGQWDDVGGGHYYWDKETGMFFSWDSPEAIQTKLNEIVDGLGMLGVSAWGLGEDGRLWEHMNALNDGWIEWTGRTLQC